MDEKVAGKEEGEGRGEVGESRRGRIGMREEWSERGKRKYGNEKRSERSRFK